MTMADAAIEYAGPSRGCGTTCRRPSAKARTGTLPTCSERSRATMRAARQFHRMLCSYARHDYAAVVGALGLGGDEQVVDAGGGVGALAQLVLEAFPSVRVTVVERAEVVEQGRRQTAGVRGSRSWRAISSRPGGPREVVILARVLHDWDDEMARRILTNARAALPEGGRVIVVEMLIPEGGVSGALCDLHLWMATGARADGP
ncbi:MAG: methyltransferase [Polyangiaceae bacterium]